MLFRSLIDRLVFIKCCLQRHTLHETMTFTCTVFHTRNTFFCFSWSLRCILAASLRFDVITRKKYLKYNSLLLSFILILNDHQYCTIIQKHTSEIFNKSFIRKSMSEFSMLPDSIKNSKSIGNIVMKFKSRLN